MVFPSQFLQVQPLQSHSHNQQSIFIFCTPLRPI
jgi:hypothetical protein